MSRTHRRKSWRWPHGWTPNPGEVKSWVKIYRGRERAEVRDALRCGEEPAPDRRKIEWEIF